MPNNPQATIAKMQIVRRAALAPGDTSGQDRAVAAQAAKAAAAAQAELQQQSRDISPQQSDNLKKILTSGNPSVKENNTMQKQLSNVYRQNSVTSTVSYSELCSNCNTLSSCNHLSAGIGVYSGISL